jgi:hypothetical protein
MAVWEDHLLPLLTCQDVGPLGCRCKALKGIVREHFKDLDWIKWNQLQAALATFPKARVVWLKNPSNEWRDVDKQALLQWLREEGRGRYLEGITLDNVYSRHSDLVHEALQDGVLPSLRRVDVNMEKFAHRASLRDGYLGAMRELLLAVDCRLDGIDQTAPRQLQLAALDLVRQLPALAKLELFVYGEDDEPVQWPPFIPPSLRELRIDAQQRYAGSSIIESQLLRYLPGMFGASGARLDRLEVLMPDEFENLGNGLVHVAQALRCCVPTLKSFLLLTGEYGVMYHDEGDDEYGIRMERLRAQWGDVLAGLVACSELQVLVLPPIKIEPLFPFSAVFGRLTHLQIYDHERVAPPDAGVVGLWELMASGGLPALAKLSVTLDGRWGGVDEVRARMVPAFEALAGTLTHLHIDKTEWCSFTSDAVDLGCKLGVAVGKLRRLRDLSLDLWDDGRAYHAMAQGVTASGGDQPLPVLWQLVIFSHIRANADLLASLLLPSVRFFISRHADIQAALLTACAVRQAKYKHAWAMWCYLPGELEGRKMELRGVLRSIVPDGTRLLYASSKFMTPLWTVPSDGRFPPSDDSA